MTAQASIDALVQSAGMIFSGTVTEIGASSVPTLPPSPSLGVVLVDRTFRADEILGDLQGRSITVEPREGDALHRGEQAIFFTRSWIHDRGIAVDEVARLDVSEAAAVADAVARLPELHLGDRLQDAAAVVEGTVAGVRPVEQKTRERNAAKWAAADLNVTRVLHGDAPESVVVYFPTADHPLWEDAPRFYEGQSGIFVLRSPARDATPSEASLEEGSFTALDPADFQQESQLPVVQKLISE
jgi:hypothetical protein